MPQPEQPDAESVAESLALRDLASLLGMLLSWLCLVRPWGNPFSTRSWFMIYHDLSHLAGILQHVTIVFPILFHSFPSFCSKEIVKSEVPVCTCSRLCEAQRAAFGHGLTAKFHETVGDSRRFGAAYHAYHSLFAAYSMYIPLYTHDITITVIISH